MEKRPRLTERFEISEFRPPAHGQIQLKASLGLEYIRIAQFQLNFVISNKILFKSSLLWFSRMSHFNDV